ncbi:hypothetical protein [Streptomyces sp. NBC_00872]|nr:hypothetical protein OG214_33635 [Streptomyces sp. NBC_00872]
MTGNPEAAGEMTDGMADAKAGEMAGVTVGEMADATAGEKP